MAADTGTVFVVDDDPSVRNAVARLLRSTGLEAIAFGSAEEFLAGPPPESPCCVVLDVRLPGVSGLDLQEELGQSRREVPIIFITGHGSVPITVRAMKAGAFDFLEKPFDDQALLDAVQWALERDQHYLKARAELLSVKLRLRRLTPREREVMELVVEGFLNKQIGGLLGASEKTIKVHRARVMRKMEAESVADLVRMAEKAGIFGEQD